MSADNAYFVIHNEKDGEHIFAVIHGFLSPFVECGTEYDPDSKYIEDLYFRGYKITSPDKDEARTAALRLAHDYDHRDEMEFPYHSTEYGVIEVELKNSQEAVTLWASEKEKGQEEIRKTINEIERANQ